MIIYIPKSTHEMIPSTLIKLKAKHTTIVSQHQKVDRQFQGITHALATKLLRCQVAATMQKAPSFPGGTWKSLHRKGGTAHLLPLFSEHAIDPRTVYYSQRAPSLTLRKDTIKV